MDIGALVTAFFDNPGPGGVVILIVLTVAIILYVLITRWILAGGKD